MRYGNAGQEANALIRMNLIGKIRTNRTDNGRGVIGATPVKNRPSAHSVDSNTVNCVLLKISKDIANTTRKKTGLPYLLSNNLRVTQAIRLQHQYSVRWKNP